MPDQPKSKRSGGSFDVPLGWVAFVIGSLLLLGWFATDVGLIPGKPPAFLYPTGIALFVCGYIACLALPRIHKRVDELEQRLDALTSQTPEQKKPGDER